MPHTITAWSARIATDPIDEHHAIKEHRGIKCRKSIEFLSHSVSTESTDLSFCTGTGEGLLTNYILPDLESARWEVIFVTCFWSSKSKSRLALCESLKRLSEKAVARREPGSQKKVTVHICISSVSLWQKLCHTTSLHGHVYNEKEWTRKLKLPAAEEIPGIDLHVKSIFIRPFSVMHPKFMIVDRQFVWVPSCNVSWETWYEGGIRLTGNTVKSFYEFWAEVWAAHASKDPKSGAPADWKGWEGPLPPLMEPTPPRRRMSSGVEYGPAAVPGRFIPSFYDNAQTTEGEALQAAKKPDPIPTLFLPSSHHRDPRFRPGSFREARAEPRTPLNAYTAYLLSKAKTQVYIQTANVTGKPILRGILGCLKEGVNVTIVTNNRLMRLEQIVTAGSTTECSVKWLVREYEKLRLQTEGDSAATAGGEATLDDRKPPGHLKISYWKPNVTGPRGQSVPPAFDMSHLKLTIVDKEVTILGSGNMDRASWYTSQELGIALYSKVVAEKIWKEVVARDVARNAKQVYPPSTS
ncbi:hypothetical protein FQN51_000242 [Onygenales sp. PD_10]|nr:hypothetical protein FQN51_000242 [Onygenales sp. PD_10]